MSERPLLPRPIAAAAIPATGTRIDIVASPEERAAIAADFGLLELPGLEAAIEARRAGDTVFLEGRVKASVVQACVVTLVAVEQQIDEAFGRRFVRGVPTPDLTTQDVDPTAEDPPDTYAEIIDFGAVALEEMALAIDPYPRAPGVEFEPPAEGDDPGEESPFAVLRRLRGEGST
ncbi:MAG: DUF177 domain-containing protein [Bauldia sp.]